MELMPERGNFRTRQRILEYSIILLIAFILVAILLPGSHNHGPSCISNVKQVTLGTIMYGSDNDDNMPPYFTFDGQEKAQNLLTALKPYVKSPNLFLCPKEDKKGIPNQEGIPGKMSYVNCLSFRGYIPKFSTGNRLMNFALIEKPAETGLFRDPIRGFGMPNPDAINKPEDGKAHFLSPHGTLFVIGYIDGHTKGRNPIDEFKEL